MVGEVAKKYVYDAARNGEVITFQQLLQEDPFLVDQVSFACSRNLLHIATMHGQVGIVETVLNINEELARDVDSKNSSPLHIAAAQGNLRIAEILLLVASEVCWWRDSHGMNPVHIAATNGHVEILKVLIEADPLAAMERLDRGQTVLHLCVKHRQLRALQVLVENFGELVYAEDDDGETALHSAVRLKQVELVEYLVINHQTYELPTNSKGKTLQQICRESLPDEESRRIKEIISHRISYSGQTVGFRGKMSDMTMVVAILIATMAFQAAVSPPGGVWQDDSSPQHKAGEAVMAFSRPKIFTSFRKANSVAFLSSLVTIILLTTGLPSRNILFMMLTMFTMWVSMASITISYVSSMIVITPNTETRTIDHVVVNVVISFVTIYTVFVLSSLVTFSSRIMPYCRRMLHRWRYLQARYQRYRYSPLCNFFIVFYLFLFS